ncbi:MAG: hypothetical protein KBD46_02490 [Candidatus Levybacteria bacterium]|nr:hypothetical protein [Candidatus Levybacteria bacterium]
MNESLQERKKLKWFLGFVIVILLITAGTDLIFSYYGSPTIPKERNPFVTVPTIMPTPLFTPIPNIVVSSTPAATITYPPLPTLTPTNIPGNLKACTMDAKECPDGTFVGRTGPNCEFVACPK